MHIQCARNMLGRSRSPLVFFFLSFLVLASLALEIPHAEAHIQQTVPASAYSPFRPFEQAVGQSWTNENLASYEDLTRTAISLFEYMRSHVDPVPRDQIEKEIPRYNRREAFGTWVNHDPENNCFDTRNEVLIRDAQDDTPIAFQPRSKCVVAKGHWLDPYTGKSYKTARSVQIDHVVPLKNAYVSGAYRWAKSRRCHYANYLENEFHLLAVSGHENMSKGNRGPEDYMPPDETYQCTYLSNWLKIKAIWELDLSEREIATIEDLSRMHRCQTKMFTIPANLLHDQRQLSQSPIAKCSKGEFQSSQQNQ